MEKVTLDEETRNALLGLNPFCSSSILEYTPDSYKIKKDESNYRIDQKYWPVFTIRPWVKSELDFVSREARAGSAKPGTDDEIKLFDHVRRAIVGIKNLINTGSLETIDFVADPDGGLSKDIFDTFGWPLRNDMMKKMHSLNGILDWERVGLRY
jgi:hypothetical protein